MIDNRGEAVGYAETTIADAGCPVSRFEPVVWENGQVRSLQTYAGDTSGVAGAINDKGQVVGASGNCASFNANSRVYPVENHALLWDRDGSVHDLGNLGGARLCHASSGELDQTQFLLGHVSVQTTEKYLGCQQRIRGAVNDRIGIEPLQ